MTVSSRMRGRFITLEGIDGAGKSTHVEVIADVARRRGVEVVLTREPGGTALGEKLRALLLSEAMHPDTEAMLMFAARREHILRVIEPALDRGAWVVSDRFTDASFAYQGGGRGVGYERLAELESWVQGELLPDMTLLFDIDIGTARARLAGARAPDRFEGEGADFFRRVRTAYLARADLFPQRIRVIDAARTPDDIRATVEDLVSIF